MGWSDVHLYAFEHQGLSYAHPHPDDAMDSVLAKDSRRAKLSKLLKAGEEFEYVYDYGDHWRHRIKVLQREYLEQSPRGIAGVMAGEGACPPEDVGGVGGFEEMLRLLNSDDSEDQDEADSWRVWLDGDFDPYLFDLRAINATLVRMAANHWGGN